MIRWLLLMYLGIACQGVTDIHSKNLTNSLKVIYEWKYIDYDFGSDEKRQAAIQSGDYNYTMNYLLDTDQWGDKTFVIIMKFNGVPSSLNVITNKTGNGGPLLAPYPDWTWAKNENCSGITSAYKIEIDMCDRLWVLDSGLINNVRSVCPPQLLVFDLNTSQLLKQVKIPHDIAVNTTTEKGALVTLSVQLLSCEVNGSTLVYIGDNEGFALIIYNNSDNSFQRLTSSTFASDPRYTTFTINGESFTLQSGIFGMALSPLTQNLYYSALSSHNLNYVNTEQFVKSQYQANNVHYQGKENILWTQASAKGISDNGVLFFGLVGDTSLACWNENRLLDRRNIEVVAKNKETLQAITGLKVKRKISSRYNHAIQRVLAKLEASINSENYYEAHQMYRTLYFRYLGQKKYSELLELLYNGSTLLLQHEQHASGADLGILFVNVLTQSGTEPSQDYFEKITNLFSIMSPLSPERDVFVQSALRWSIKNTDYKIGHPDLHQKIAQVFWREKNYVMARQHFIYSRDGSGCAAMLVELHEQRGYKNEIDLFIAQAVLQYLCLQNKTTAQEVFNSYTSQHPKINRGPPYLLPLLNFLFFLLKIVDSGKLAVFTVLCEQYRISLNRDPCYRQYLDKIGQLFFNVPSPRPRNQGLFGTLLQSFFNGLEDEGSDDEQRNIASTSQTAQELD